MTEIEEAEVAECSQGREKLLQRLSIQIAACQRQSPQRDVWTVRNCFSQAPKFASQIIAAKVKSVADTRSDIV